MVKKKNKRSRRQGLFSKVTNALLIALAFAQPIRLALQGQWGAIVYAATFGFGGNPQTGIEGGNLDLSKGIAFYAPAGAAVALGTLKHFVMKKFPVR